LPRVSRTAGTTPLPAPSPDRQLQLLHGAHLIRAIA
jgi:hypothetical protein